MIVQGKTQKWELVIGLEIHAQLNSRTKLFSCSSTNFNQDNNQQVSYIDAAMPGMLPRMNKRCVELAVKAGLGLNGKINKFSMFDRKNYFYPDSPQGYQISQFFFPIVSEASLEIRGDNGEKKTIAINRIHIEQDAGKSVHDRSETETLIDLNRAGIPLIEIVTDPDFSSPQEIEQFIKKLRNILRYIDVCDGDLEKGSMRCDANISVRKVGDLSLGKRVEIKNLNSFKHINKAIIYEAKRQINLLENSQHVIQETRSFNTDSGETKLIRVKENAEDYRYFPDPDLLPLRISEEFIKSIQKTIPELPEDKKIRYMKEFSLTSYDAEVLIENKNVSKFFEKVVGQGINPKVASNWICAELFGKLNKKGIEFSDIPLSAKNFGSLINAIINNKISGRIAKDILEIMLQKDEDPETIIKSYNLSQISSEKDIEKYVDLVINSNPNKVEEYKSGKTKLFAFFVGQVMKASKGKANPQRVNEILEKKLY